MKKIYLFIWMMFIHAVIVISQDVAHETFLSEGPNFQENEKLPNPFQNANNPKDGEGWRIKADSYFDDGDGTLAPTDSTSYSYASSTSSEWNEKIVYKWNGTAWIKHEKTTITENENITTIFQKWNGSAWEDDRRRIENYDSQGRKTNRLDQDWDATLWINVSQINWVYEGNSTTQIEQDWTAGAWENKSKDITVYHTPLLYESVTSYEWANGSWENDSKVEYTYTSSDKPLLFKTFLGDGSSWKNNSRWIYSYDNDDNNDSTIFEGWNQNDGDWLRYYLELNTFSNQNLIINTLRKTWVTNSQTYQNNRNTTYTYNEDGNNTFWLVESWVNNAWENSDRSFYEYDGFGNLITQNLEYWVNDWVEYYRMHNYWESYNASDIYELAYLNLKIYPNPVSDLLNIEISESINAEYKVVILSQSGAQLAASVIKNSKANIDLSPFAPGIYFVTVSDGENKSTKKIVKK